MKIERIDENSIRCTLTSLDLSSRNINLRDMTYGSEAAKRLFSEMMQKARIEVGFSPENGPLMIEAVPLQGGAVQLVISKVDDPEELDTRFSKFAQNGLPQNGWLSQIASELLEGAQDLMKKLKEQENEAKESSAAEDNAAAEEPERDMVRIFRFAALDSVLRAAKAIAGSYSGQNALYKEPDTGSYYLVLHAGKKGAVALSRATNILSEYGEKVQESDLLEYYYQEHFESILKRNAVKKLSEV